MKYKCGVVDCECRLRVGRGRQQRTKGIVFFSRAMPGLSARLNCFFECQLLSLRMSSENGEIPYAAFLSSVPEITAKSKADQ